MSLALETHAQNTDPTADPFVVMQGQSNLGETRPFTMTEVITNTGIVSYRSQYTGKGQRIGILDLGFGQLLSLNSAQIKVFPGQTIADYDAHPSTHGTDVLEIVQSIAPDAEYFLCQYSGFDDFVSCIDWMIVSGVHIINHSAGVAALPLDGHSLWALEADRASRENILWINAAGNFAGGYIRGYFTDTNKNNLHEFRGIGIIETLTVGAIEQAYGRVMLSWGDGDSHAANEIDLNLEVVDESGKIIASSSAPQTGRFNESALEIVTIDMRHPFGIRISHSNLAQDDRANQVPFALFVEFADLPIGESAISIITPADSINVLTVGALQNNAIAPYSSRGPVETGGIKPDLTAPGEIQLSSGRLFVGTSAAAPIVSGAAALIWEANPDWSNRDVMNFLRSTALDDSDIPGADTQYGMGRLYLSASLDELPNEALAPPSSPSQNVIPPQASTAVTSIQTEVEQGDFVILQSNSSKFQIRVSPSRNESIWFEAPSGSAAHIISDEAVVDNGVRWYRVQIMFTNLEGWVEENLITPVAVNPQLESQYARICPGAYGYHFEIGQRFIVAVGDGATSIYSEPNSKPIVGKIEEGEGGYIVAGPVCKEGQSGNMLTWRVQADNGGSGWVSEGYESSPIPWVLPLPIFQTVSTNDGVSTASQLPIVAYPPVDRQAAVRNYTSIWSLTNYRDLYTPGTADYIVTVNADEIYRFAFTWCVDKPEELQEAVQPLSVQFFIDDIPLNSSHVSQTTLDGVCVIWETLLNGWQANNSVQLKIVYTLNESILNGLYSAGTYTQRIRINPQ